ncbi:MAG: phosphopantetheine-binding protein [Nitrospiraceae bacterium]|nr:phosphopantetheine-binding protein [Nitrospiraceae bacterium]
MTDEEIKKTIFRVLGTIAPEADFGALSPAENLRQALDIDSFDFLNVVIGISKELGIDIPESDYGKITTLEEMAGYLSKRK